MLTDGAARDLADRMGKRIRSRDYPEFEGRFGELLEAACSLYLRYLEESAPFDPDDAVESIADALTESLGLDDEQDVAAAALADEVVRLAEKEA